MMQDIQFNMYYDILRPENSFGSPSYHKFYEIVYYRDGSGFATINAVKYKYTAGTYAIIRPNIIHDDEYINNTNLSVLNFTVRDDAEKLPIGLYYDSNRSVIKILDKIKKEFSEVSLLSEKFLNVYCSELYLTIIRNLNNTDFASDKIDYIIRYIEEFYENNITVNELAEISRYSCRHFRELFKSRTGLSPLEFILQKRLNMSKQLLEHSNKSIIDISQSCGFSSSSQFSSMFKRFTGITPKKYRNNNISDIAYVKTINTSEC